jgi:hypothetical protein
VSDPSGTDAQHPALVTVTGVAEPPLAAPAEVTGTDDGHPAIVTRPGPV